ncbi:MAG TPA: DUF3109 family protein [Bellilinea sp.]|nr:DUF3109 family protein [Bellilinea sp.]
MDINPRMLMSEPMRRCELGECHGACCLHGVWLDLAEWDNIQAHAGEIKASMDRNLNLDPSDWVEGSPESDPFAKSGKVIHSCVVNTQFHYGGTACVFWRTDAKCALQVAAERAGLHPWTWKPFYCILHPLDLDEHGRITLDETSALLAEPASCLRRSDVSIPLTTTFEEELRYFLGDERFSEFAQGQNSGSI